MGNQSLWIGKKPGGLVSLGICLTGYPQGIIPEGQPRRL
jgi:hypothetical protein